VSKWERIRRNNHWFDTLYDAAAAGRFCSAPIRRDEEAAAASTAKKDVRNRLAPSRRTTADRLGALAGAELLSMKKSGQCGRQISISSLV